MNFELRPWCESDWESVFKYANNKKIADNLRNVFPFPYSEEDARDYVNSCAQNSGERQLTRAIVVNGEAVGSIGVFLKDDVYSRSAELGYWLAEPFWGRGIMSNAIRQISNEAFKRYDIVRIFAEPYAYNAGSRKALEHAGFQLEGCLRKSVWKNGALCDSCIYALVK